MTAPFQLHAADLFCGAGGTTTGLKSAAAARGIDLKITAVNHWPTAVQTHHLNHPDDRHVCASVDNINPYELFAGGRINARSCLDLLWASPECTHHSVARGGRPINDQSRATAWCVIRWAEKLMPTVILCENVKEFLTWGPVDRRGQPIKSKKGHIFRAWVQALESLGYTVEWKLLCAANYGDPTTRTRLIIQAVRGRRKPLWPDSTHTAVLTGRTAAPTVPAGASPADPRRASAGPLPWIPARDIIDWTDLGTSIYTRKKPLAPKTMRRIMSGLETIGLAPFVIPQHRGGRPVHTVDEPLSTITTTARGIGLATPYLIHLRGTGTVLQVTQPAPASGQHLGLCSPYLVQLNHGNKPAADDHRRVKSIEDPLVTVTCNRGDLALCAPYIATFDHQGSNGACVAPVTDPLTTATTKQRHALCTPYLVEYYGQGQAQPLTDPVPTVTCNDRFGLVIPQIARPHHTPETLSRMPRVRFEDGAEYSIDILFRMLKWRELARAQSFPDDYQFHGNTTDIVKQIGNSVPVRLATALGRCALDLILS